jgi:hypothetical protein
VWTRQLEQEVALRVLDMVETSVLEVGMVEEGVEVEDMVLRESMNEDCMEICDLMLD